MNAGRDNGRRSTVDANGDDDDGREYGKQDRELGAPGTGLSRQEEWAKNKFGKGY